MPPTEKKPLAAVIAIGRTTTPSLKGESPLVSSSSTVILGRYTVVKTLSENNGRVYLAIDTQTEKKVVVREVPKATKEYENAAKVARREYELGSTLKHTGLVHYTGMEETDTHLYVIREYAEGKTLAENGKLDDAERTTAFSKILDIVGYVHSRGLILRDLKPSNIVLQDDGTVKIIEVGGIIEEGKRDEHDTLSTLYIAATFAYAAPETIGQGIAHKPGDVFALGQILAFLCTGSEVGFDTTAKKRDFGAIEDAQHRTVVEKAMSLDSSERYQTVEEMKKALNESALAVRIVKPIRLWERIGRFIPMRFMTLAFAVRLIGDERISYKRFDKKIAHLHSREAADILVSGVFELDPQDSISVQYRSRFSCFEELKRSIAARIDNSADARHVLVSNPDLSSEIELRLAEKVDSFRHKKEILLTKKLREGAQCALIHDISDAQEAKDLLVNTNLCHAAQMALVAYTKTLQDAKDLLMNAGLCLGVQLALVEHITTSSDAKEVLRARKVNHSYGSDRDSYSCVQGECVACCLIEKLDTSSDAAEFLLPNKGDTFLHRGFVITLISKVTDSHVATKLLLTLNLDSACQDELLKKVTDPNDAKSILVTKPFRFHEGVVIRVSSGPGEYDSWRCNDSCQPCALAKKIGSSQDAVDILKSMPLILDLNKYSFVKILISKIDNSKHATEILLHFDNLPEEHQRSLIGEIDNTGDAKILLTSSKPLVDSNRVARLIATSSDAAEILSKGVSKCGSHEAYSPPCTRCVLLGKIDNVVDAKTALVTLRDFIKSEYVRRKIIRYIKDPTDARVVLVITGFYLTDHDRYTLCRVIAESNNAEYAGHVLKKTNLTQEAQNLLIRSITDPEIATDVLVQRYLRPVDADKLVEKVRTSDQARRILLGGMVPAAPSQSKLVNLIDNFHDAEELVLYCSSLDAYTKTLLERKMEKLKPK